MAAIIMGAPTVCHQSIIHRARQAQGCKRRPSAGALAPPHARMAAPGQPAPTSSACSRRVWRDRAKRGRPGPGPLAPL